MTGPGTCLITGATGFIGGHLTARLVRDGHRARCLVRPSSDTSRLEELGAEIVVGDVTSAPSVAVAADGCRSVLHCAALVSDWATPREIAAINVAGTRNVVDAAARASVRRVVHVSTTDVYGHPGTAAVDETQAPTRFANWYAETKRAAEAEVRRAEQAHGLDAVVLRPATVYGPRSTDVVGEIARAMRNGTMVLVDGGRANAGLCYVDNLVDLAVLALRHEAARGQVFNATDGLDVTWRQFADDLAAGLGVSRVRRSLPYRLAHGAGFALEHGYRFLHRTTGLTTPALLSRQAVQVLGVHQDFSNRKARDLLGWRPRVAYPAGLEATLDWLRDEQHAPPGARRA